MQFLVLWLLLGVAVAKRLSLHGHSLLLAPRRSPLLRKAPPKLDHRAVVSHAAGHVNLSVKQKMLLDIQLADSPCDGAHLSRQNVHLPLGRSCRHQFKDNDFHKEHMVITKTGETSIYLRTSEMCGAGLFTQPKLDCSETSRKDLAKVMDSLPKANLVAQRGFGVELELVGRDPSNWTGGSLSLSWELARISAQFLDTQPGVNGALDTSRERQSVLLPGLKRCMKKKIKEGQRHQLNCSSHDGCAVSDYCRKQHATTFRNFKSGYCKPREKCTPVKSVDGTCEVPLKRWQWTTDPSVRPLSVQQAEQAGVADVVGETKGVGFELISPGPPHVLAGYHGLKSVAEAMGVLQKLGIQAGPSSGMHVHVNVGRPWKKNSPRLGTDLRPPQILNVWAHYARFQLVIHEMFQDSRIGNSYAYPLLFSDHATIVSRSGNLFPSVVEKTIGNFEMAKTAVLDTYVGLHTWVKTFGNGTERQIDFCNSIATRVFDRASTMQTAPLGEPCTRRYPKARYFQVNLMPLDRLGTIEFRGFPATTDPKRVLEWVHFITSFVEHYKDDYRFIDAELARNDPEHVDVEPLRTAQRKASLDTLATEMSMNLNYWKERSWLKQSAACQTEEGPRTNGVADYVSEAEYVQDALERGLYVPEVIDDEEA